MNSSMVSLIDGSMDQSMQKPMAWNRRQLDQSSKGCRLIFFKDSSRTCFSKSELSGLSNELDRKVIDLGLFQNNNIIVAEPW